MATKLDSAGTRLDDAARAGWLYYVAGNNQEQIAKKLGISRQTAQRLVSLSVSEGLIKVRLDHPIARCMELAEKLPRPLRPRFLRSRPLRSRLVLHRARPRPGRCRRNRTTPQGRGPHRHGARHRPHPQGGDRAADADGVPAAPHRLAHRQHRTGRLGFVLQRHLFHGRCGQGPQFSYASAGHRLFRRRARHAPAASPW